ncbi:hypothetical protein [Flavobacterium undicola]|uniref:hypothetical protein n=1 Tax=Flavobacterium undicola TaxID=1932779 RepID=UPI001378C843|nr:hypothetical protein [Flavobacterium undicola]MBA0884801.1 hypothetical protein [Flavobacterium undicola]
MKISNIIFISFLIFLFGGITLLFIGSKYYKGINDKSNFAIQEKKTPPFSVVVAEPGAIFYLKNGKQNKIKQSYRKDAVPNFAPFVVRNDTLFMYSVKKEQSKEPYLIIVPEVFCVNVKSIVAKENSDVHLEKFETDTLSVTMNKSRLDWRFDTVTQVSIKAKESNIYLEGEKIENLAVKLDKTKLRAAAKIRIDKLSGSLKNDSGGDFSLSNSVHLDADKTSNYVFYN